jgi:translocation and assembly module TamA
VTFRRNNNGARDRILTVQALASSIDRSAFEARTISLTGRLEQTSTLIYQKLWTWSAGIDILATDELAFVPARNASVRETYFIGALSALVTYDRSNDILDPTSGFRLSGRVQPEFSLSGDANGYMRLQFDGTYYHPLGERTVLAGRMRMGSIVGASTLAIAPSRRYYAGGGSSVRGYGFQAISPRDPGGQPLGGRSLVELAAEARVRFGVFAVVPFVDVGTVSTSSRPDLQEWRVGAGVGVRYHSNFGPIRVDVGTPINPRPGDSRVAVYVSLGQAF